MKRRRALAKKVKQVGRAKSSKVWCVRHKGEASQGGQGSCRAEAESGGEIMRRRLKDGLVI